MSILRDEIPAERARQDAKWGGAAHDDQHNTGEFVQFIWQRLHGNATTRKDLIQIAALAVAAVESMDRRATPTVPVGEVTK